MVPLEVPFTVDNSANLWKRAPVVNNQFWISRPLWSMRTIMHQAAPSSSDGPQSLKVFPQLKFYHLQTLFSRHNLFSVGSSCTTTLKLPCSTAIPLKVVRPYIIAPRMAGSHNRTRALHLPFSSITIMVREWCHNLHTRESKVNCKSMISLIRSQISTTKQLVASIQSRKDQQVAASDVWNHLISNNLKLAWFPKKVLIKISKCINNTWVMRKQTRLECLALGCNAHRALHKHIKALNNSWLPLIRLYFKIRWLGSLVLVRVFKGYRRWILIIPMLMFFSSHLLKAPTKWNQRPKLILYNQA